MKIYPNCQTIYADGSQDEALLVDLQESQILTRKKSDSSLLISLILGGFLLFAISTAGCNSEQAQSNTTANTSNLTTQKPAKSIGNNDLNLPAVQIETNPQTQSNSKTIIQPQTAISASSAKKPEKENFYFPNMAFDRNPATAWSEGIEGGGEGEWLRFDFDGEATLKQIKIQPGFFKNGDEWAKNNRLQSISLEFSDGTAQEGVRFSDTMQTQTINVGQVRTRTVKIIIDEYYAGTSATNDTLISEVEFVTEP